MKFQSKIKNVEKQRREFLSNANRLENKFLDAILDFYVADLDFDGGKIKTNSSNKKKARQLRNFINRFLQTEFNPFLRKSLKLFRNIVSNNEAYFRRIQKVQKGIRGKVQRKVFDDIGVKTIKGKLYLQPEGWLKSLSDTPEPYRRIRQIATQAVRNGVTIEAFRKQIKDYVKPSGKQGPILRHLYTNASDAFAQFERLAADEFAQEIGLKHFRYQGGEVNESRAFCIGGVDPKTGYDFEPKNRMIFHVDEVDDSPEWTQSEWSGKNENYEPLRDLGGHGCRHFKDYVSKKKALRERPELIKYN